MFWDAPPVNRCAVRACIGFLERLCLNPPLCCWALSGCEPWHRSSEAACTEKRCADTRPINERQKKSVSSAREPAGTSSGASTSPRRRAMIK
ncbi:unnamed protein product, partial [Mycena citricolor]